MEESLTFAERLERVRNRVAQAALASARDVASIRLLAVSKFHPAQAVHEAFTAGQRLFGESYVQEAQNKQDALGLNGLEWHLIGHLQRNKAKAVVGRFSLIHTLDSEALAETLQTALEKAAPGSVQDVLIQVNIGEETQKTGISLKSLPKLAEKTIISNRLRLKGLMIIPPFFDEPEKTRPYFARLRETRDDLQKRLGMELPHLSMGMSADLEQAIAEGATIVRVGTDIFGPRPRREA